MTVAEMQVHVIRRLLCIGGSDMQVIDGRMCEISVRQVTEETADEAVKRVMEGQEHASASD